MTQLMENALMGSILILVTAALRRVLRNRLPAGTWLVLWGVCLFRLLTPVSPNSALSLYRLPRLLAGTMETTLPAPAPANQWIVSAKTPLRTVTEQSAGSYMPSLSTVLWRIYLLCAAFLALYFVWVWLSTRRAVGRTILLERNDPRYATLPKYARLREGPMEGAPLTFGVVRPTVVLYPGLAGAELDWALTHEAVHARRRDNLWNYAMIAALVVHWYNPAVWLMARLLRRDVELACDRAVLARLGGDRRVEYASTIISMSTQAGGPAFCHRFGPKQAEERIIAIMKYKKTTITSLVLALVLVCGITAALAASAPQEAPEPDGTILSASIPEPDSAIPSNDVSEPDDTVSNTIVSEPGPDASNAEWIAYFTVALQGKSIHVVTPELAYEYAYAIECTKKDLAEEVATGRWSQEEVDKTIARAEYTLELIRAGEFITFLPNDVMSLEHVSLSMYSSIDEFYPDPRTVPAKPGSEGYHLATAEEYAQLVEIYKELLAEEAAAGQWTQDEVDENTARAENTLELISTGYDGIWLRDNFDPTDLEHFEIPCR